MLEQWLEMNRAPYLAMDPQALQVSSYEIPQRGSMPVRHAHRTHHHSRRRSQYHDLGIHLQNTYFFWSNKDRHINSPLLICG